MSCPARPPALFQTPTHLLGFDCSRRVQARDLDLHQRGWAGSGCCPEPPEAHSNPPRFFTSQIHTQGSPFLPLPHFCPFPAWQPSLKHHTTEWMVPVACPGATELGKTFGPAERHVTRMTRGETGGQDERDTRHRRTGMTWACLCNVPYAIFHPHGNIFLEVIGAHSAVANQTPNVSLVLPPAPSRRRAGGGALPLSVMLSRLSNVSAPSLRANARLFSSAGRNVSEKAVSRARSRWLFQTWRVASQGLLSDPVSLHLFS